MQIWIAIIASFLLGSIPTAFIVVRILQQRDIRQMGSGNVGTMNVRDQLGYGPALLVLIIDAGKGAAAVGLGRYLGVDSGPCLAMAVAGHIYPPWLSFKGGKGLATALGGILASWQWAALAVFAVVWLPAYLVVTRKNGDRSNLAGALGLAAYGLFGGPLGGPQWWIVVIGLLIAAKHYLALRIKSTPSADKNEE